MAAHPVSSGTLWPDPKTGPWWVTVHWREQHGSAVAVGLELTSWLDDDWDRERRELLQGVLPESDAEVEFPAIDSQFIKALPIGQILTQSRRGMVELADAVQLPGGWPGEAHEDFPELLRSELQRDVEFLRRSPKPGRDLGEGHYAEVAKIYAAAVREGRPPTIAVAEHFTISKSAAAKQVARARERGLLPRTTRGRVGKLSEEL